MNRDRAADTLASPGQSALDTLVSEMDTMLAEEGSESPDEGSAPSDAESTPDETASEDSAETTEPPKMSKAPSGKPSPARATVDATLAQVAELQARANEERSRAEQLEKDRRETQSYADRQRNEAQETIQQLREQNAELQRQLQAVSSRQSTHQEDDDDYFSSDRDSRQVPDIDNHPTVQKLMRENALMMERITDAENQRKTEAQRSQQQGKEAQQRQFLANTALEAAKEIFPDTPLDGLTQYQATVIQGILTAYHNGDANLGQKLWRQALAAETESRMASVRQRASKTRVISEAGTSSGADDTGLDDDFTNPDEVFKDLNWDYGSKANPQARAQRLSNLVTAADRFAKAPA
uniref:Uncharacterized protein n=1 Tax=viral metagenome TaxID=1070528 RepID=A0A6M3IZV3_9ZZZZ